MTLDLGFPIFRLSLVYLRYHAEIGYEGPSPLFGNLTQAGPRLLLRWPWMHASTLSRWLHFWGRRRRPLQCLTRDRPRDFGGEMAGRVGKQRVSACKTWDIHSRLNTIELFFARVCQFNMNSRTWGITMYYLPKHHRFFFLVGKSTWLTCGAEVMMDQLVPNL